MPAAHSQDRDVPYTMVTCMEFLSFKQLRYKSSWEIFVWHCVKQGFPKESLLSQSVFARPQWHPVIVSSSLPTQWTLWCLGLLLRLNHLEHSLYFVKATMKKDANENIGEDWKSSSKLASLWPMVLNENNLVHSAKLGYWTPGQDCTSHLLVMPSRAGFVGIFLRDQCECFVVWNANSPPRLASGLPAPVNFLEPSDPELMKFLHEIHSPLDIF